MRFYPESFEKLIYQLSKLPSIGRKSAQRMAFKILDMKDEEVSELILSISNAKKNIKNCNICGNITEDSVCEICKDDLRDVSIITVVEDSASVRALEKTKDYNGLYHVLGIGSAHLNSSFDEIDLDTLLARAEKPEVKEIILAISPTVEGNNIILLLKELLKDKNVKVSRIAQGVPLGANLDYYDEFSFLRAIEDRKRIL